MDQLVEHFEQSVRAVALQEQLQVAIVYEDVFATTYNDVEATALVLSALRNTGTPYQVLSRPMRWSEDFGVYGQIAKSAMFVLGAGRDHPQLHDSNYDFPDELIATGAQIFVQIVQEVLDRWNEALA